MQIAFYTPGLPIIVPNTYARRLYEVAIMFLCTWKWLFRWWGFAVMSRSSFSHPGI